MQRRFGAQHGIEVAHQARHALALVACRPCPVQCRIVRPLLSLTELAAHEQQFAARVRPHETVVRAELGQPLRRLARHLGQQRSLAVHHLVMRKRKHKPFGEGVDQAEADLTMVMLAMNRIAPEVLQGVVHPAHVPFVGETKPALLHRRGHPWPCGGFLGDHQHVREALPQRLVHPP